MKFSDLDPSTLCSISVRHLVRYLTSYSWAVINCPKFPDITIMRKNFGDREEEIVVPRNQSFADFPERIFDVIYFLSKFENRTIDDILGDLWAIESDVLRIRISGGCVGSGKIPFLDEMTIKDGLKKVLSSAACQVLEPRSFYKKLHRTESEQLLRNCQLGQSERGSYVIKFYFPILNSTPLQGTLPTDDNDKPFARRVAEHLMISLKNIVNSIDNNMLPNALTPKVNANLCFGLVEMSGDSKVDLDFQMSWSEEVLIDTTVPRKVTIHNNYIPMISKMGENLKPQQEVTQNDFIGKISTLSGSENEQGYVEGDIILILLVDEDTRKAKAFLDTKRYSEACDAHKNGNYVRISGLLKEKPRLNILEDVSSFEIIPK